MKTEGTKITIVVENDTFSVDELKKIVQCIREIEQNKPERHISVLMDTPEKTTGEMLDVVGSAQPGFPFKAVIELKQKETGDVIWQLHI